MIFNKRKIAVLVTILLVVLFFAIFYLAGFYKSFFKKILQLKSAQQTENILPINTKKMAAKKIYIKKKPLPKMMVKIVEKNRKVIEKQVAAQEPQKKIRQNQNKDAKIYLPYLQIENTYFFNTNSSKSVTNFDLFVPIWQVSTSLIFIDIKLYDYSGRPFMGNFYLGYRHLLPEEQKLWGIYSSFDRKRTYFDSYFNQITLGGEYWIKNLFIGGNFYKTIGKTLKPVNSGYVEKSMSGIDAEIGYELVKGLISYVGGYYFGAKEVNNIYGARARLSYDWSLDNGNRILGIFDKIGLEVVARRDKIRGTAYYARVNVRIGWFVKERNMLSGVSYHMLDSIYRYTDIVSIAVAKKDSDPVLDSNPQKLIPQIDTLMSMPKRNTQREQNDTLREMPRRKKV